MKYRTIVVLLSLHLMVSMIFWGGLCVWQRCRNTLEWEQVAAASIRVSEQQAYIQVLDASCTIPIKSIPENNPLYLAVNTLTSDAFHFWWYLLDYAYRNILQIDCS